MIRVKLEGKRFGELIVIRQLLKRDKNRKIRWKCRCSCGNTTITTSNCLLTGNTKSCGCKKYNWKYLNLKHGESSGINKTKEYRTWRNIKSRCLNINNIDYVYYGKRGITICNEWKKSFENFLKDVGRAPGKNFTLERINNNGNYEKFNCKWVTRKEQANNTRKNIIIIACGRKMTKSEWISFLGVEKGWFDRRWYKDKNIIKILKEVVKLRRG